MTQLHADCLDNIFKYLMKEKATLRSCLLVNRLWCEVSVRIYWRRIRNYNTLIACLPNESKEILFKNGIVSASKPPIFNYVSFCKALSSINFFCGVKKLLENQQSISSQNLSDILPIVI